MISNSQNTSMPQSEIEIVSTTAKKIEAHNIANFSKADRETMLAVSNFISTKYEHLNQLDVACLLLFKGKLEQSIIQLTKETSGIKAFFNRVIDPEQRKLHVAKEMERDAATDLLGIISKLPPLENLPEQGSSAQEKAAQPHNVQKDVTQPHIEDDSTKEPSTPKETSVAPPPPLENSAPPAPSLENSGPPAPSFTDAPPAPTFDAPPLLGDDVPPPPLFLQPVKPEETHNRREQEKLEQNLQKRATPIGTFVIQTPPKNEEALKNEQASLEEELSVLSGLMAYIPKSNQDDKERLEALIESKEKRLETVKQNRMPAESRLKGYEDSNFIATAQKLTNDELKIIIGIHFNGNVPATDSKNYKEYRANQEVYNEIFRDWKRLSEQTASGKAFLKNQTEWQDYLDRTSATMDFVKILARRAPEVKIREYKTGKDKMIKNPDYLREPTYEAAPYKPYKSLFGTKATTASPKPAAPKPATPKTAESIDSTQQKKGFLDELKGFRLKHDK